MYSQMRLKLASFLAVISCWLLMFSGLWAATPKKVPSEADSIIVNGVWDETQAEANAPGELTITISGVYSGVRVESLSSSDTIVVDTGFAFSSLESLLVSDHSGVTSYDTIYIYYWFQNYGNLATDTFYVLARILDTTNNTGHFTPTDFDLVIDTVGTFKTGADSVVTTGNPDDSAWYNIVLSEGSIGSLYVRLVIPSPDSAADKDSIHIELTVKDRFGTGTDDGWPGSRVIIDTTNPNSYRHTKQDTIKDYGDTQKDTVKVVIGGPKLRIRKITLKKSGGTLPGDLLDYTIYYDNDGSAASEDTAFIVDYLPKGVAFVGTLSVAGGAGNGDTILTYWYYNPGGSWITHMPDTSTIGGRDSLLRITRLKFAIPPGIAATAGDDADDEVADDSTGNDAGMIKFRVRIR